MGGPSSRRTAPAQAGGGMVGGQGRHVDSIFPIAEGLGLMQRIPAALDVPRVSTGVPSPPGASIHPSLRPRRGVVGAPSIPRGVETATHPRRSAPFG